MFEEELSWLVVATVASIAEALIVSYFAAWLESKKDAKDQLTREQMSGLLVQNILDSEARVRKSISKSRKQLESKIEELRRENGGS